jgi:membrane protein required for colicin V production
MNWLDLLIIGILAWTTFRAFSSGLIREVVSLLGLVAGIALSGAFYDDLSSNLEFVIADPTTRQLAAFAAIFVGTTVAGAVIAAVLHTAAALLFLGPLDKLGGAVFGLIKGLLMVQILLVAVSVFPAQTTVANAVAASTLAPAFLRFSPVIKAALPQEFQDPLGQLQRWQTGIPAVPGVLPGPAATPKR